MQSIELFFGSKALRYQVRSTSAAQKWFSLLQKKLQSPPLFSKPPHHRGFKPRSLELSEGLQALKNCCQLIDEYDSSALPADWPSWLASTPNQDQLNRLHYAFEKMRGEADEPRPYFVKAPAPIQKAIVELNEGIHQMEWLMGQGESKVVQVKTEFCDFEKQPMTLEDFEAFSLERPFGSIFLHYCQVGKTWLEVFEEQDEVAAPESIRPLSWISGEFDIRFGNTPPGYPLERELRDWLRSRGLDPFDPRLALGWVVVADLVSPLVEESKPERAGFIEELIAAGPFHSMKILSPSA